jgi:cyclopropane fatty-acyl-phospholipid synthase-like methyltransferase
MKPYSESCDQNRAPILEVLRIELADRERLLEIGSGTGQHAVYFAPEFPGLLWQTSDMADMHAGIHAWLAEQGCSNILPPLTLDVYRDSWPATSYDAVFSANTVHIMDWQSVECLFAGIGYYNRVAYSACTARSTTRAHIRVKAMPASMPG